MYRVLREHDEVHERRRQATHPARIKPELVASAPNVVWSWDITKLLGPAKWTYYYLYVILDIFSRYVAGWMVALAECARLAERLTAASPGRAADRAQLRDAGHRPRPIAHPRRSRDINDLEDGRPALGRSRRPPHAQP